MPEGPVRRIVSGVPAGSSAPPGSVIFPASVTLWVTGMVAGMLRVSVGRGSVGWLITFTEYWPVATLSTAYKVLPSGEKARPLTSGLTVNWLASVPFGR